MRAAAELVATGAVVGRDGSWVGLVGDLEVVADRSFDAAATVVAERLLAAPRNVLTVLAGAGAPSLDALLAALEARHPDLEYDVHAGGQPDVPLLLGAE